MLETTPIQASNPSVNSITPQMTTPTPGSMVHQMLSNVHQANQDEISVNGQYYTPP